MPHVEAGDQAEKIDLDPFDPTELHAEQPPQRRLDAGSAVGQAEIGMGAETLADCIRWERDAELRHRAEQGGDEGVAVRSRPCAVVARIVVGVTGDVAATLGMSAAASAPRTSARTRGTSPNQRPSGAQPLWCTGRPQFITS